MPINQEDALIGVVERIKSVVDVCGVDITHAENYKFSRLDGSYSVSSFVSY